MVPGTPDLRQRLPGLSEREGQFMATMGQDQGMAGGASDLGRATCLIGGSLLTVIGLRRGGPLGIGLALAGGALALRGATGMPLSGRGSMFEAGLTRLERSLPATSTIKIKRSVTIAKPREEVWRFVRDLSNFPRWASHVESVTVTGDGRSHWIVRAPGGTRLEWDAEIEAEVENERISWKSMEGADIRHAGVLGLHDAPGGRGTELNLRLAYDAPAGKLGEAIAWLFGEEPDTQARDDLRRLKQLLETGEITAPEMRSSGAATGQTGAGTAEAAGGI